MARKTKTKSRMKLQIPHAILLAFVVVAIFLVPWSLWLSYSLPIDHLDHRWNLAWSIFDLGLLVSMGITAYLGARRSGWVTIFAAVTGTFLLVDAWFDCATATNSWEHFTSVSSALLIELPLGFLAFWIAYRAGRQYFSTE